MSDPLAEVKRRLAAFAAQEAAGVSPLYEHLAAHAAEDDEIAGLLLAASSPEEARAPLLFATAHRLIQAEPIHPLSRYYPSLGGFDGVDGGTWPEFRGFLAERADKAKALISSRYTQTNEVRRAALLYPAVALAAKAGGGKFALLEAGCSAGLLLGLDTFGYRYQCGGDQLTAGPAKAAVGLHCALELAEGAVAPKIPKKLQVGAKLGLDRAPVDAADEDELAWLEACVWADQVDRIRLLRTAAAAQRKKPPELVTGDLVDDLGAAVGRLPAELPLVLLTSHVVTYLAKEKREAFVEAVSALGRPVWWVSQEAYEAGLEPLLPGRDDLRFADTRTSTLGLVEFGDGAPRAQALARTAPHGQRMTWL
ncbi:DUF2332 domain-containing protein [Amycolatopsis magusensis]|uniref:DUF2332 domain-containing protein n=1 Tax=Amycolatopsis magusensis TaxID=882444 RepID=UPI00379CFA8C